MAINFQPAAPFSPTIAEKFGETEQWNRFAPLLAQQYQAAANRRSAESIATAQNQTSASAASEALQGRKQMQDAEIDAGRQQQQMQIAAQMQMQERQMAARLAEQQMENDRYNFAITRQEEQENVARMNGLAEIERQAAEGLLTPEQAGDARTQLITKIRAFDNRRTSQQAKMMEQQAQMQAKVFADNQKNIAEAQAFGKATAGHNWVPIQQGNGDVEFYAYDPQKGTYYQVGKRTAAAEKPEKPAGKYADESGEFSYKKALPELKAEAEIAFPVKKESGEGGKSVDVNEAARADYIQTLARREEEKHRQAVQARQQQSSAAPGAQQPAQQQVDPEIAKLQAKGLPPDQLQFATEVVQLMRTLIGKGKTDGLTPEEKAQLATAVEQYKSFQR